MTNDKKPRKGDKCEAKRTKHGGAPCQLPAGWGTDHAGIGRCKLHGGRPNDHYVCACEDYETARDVRAHESHIAQATEAAVREQIAAQIEAQPPEYFSATMISKALAAEIARGRS